MAFLHVVVVSSVLFIFGPLVPVLHPSHPPEHLLAVSFDLDDTLWPVGPVIAHAEQAGLAWFYANAPRAVSGLAPEKRKSLLARALEGLASSDHRREERRYLRTRAYELALLDAGYHAGLAQDAFAAFDAARQEVEPFDDVIAALERLSRRFVLVAITNGTADLRRIGWSRYFRHSVAPALAGAAKPDARIFLHACELLGMAPDAVLHVGDDPQLDVIAAHRAGLHAAWIDRLHRPWPVADTPAPATFASLTELTQWLDP